MTGGPLKSLESGGVAARRGKSDEKCRVNALQGPFNRRATHARMDGNALGADCPQNAIQGDRSTRPGYRCGPCNVFARAAIGGWMQRGDSRLPAGRFA